MYFWLLNVFCDACIANAEGKAEAFALKCVPKLFLQVATKGAALAVVFLPVDPFVVDTAFFEGADSNDARWWSGIMSCALVVWVSLVLRIMVLRTLLK